MKDLHTQKEPMPRAAKEANLLLLFQLPRRAHHRAPAGWADDARGCGAHPPVRQYLSRARNCYIALPRDYGPPHTCTFVTRPWSNRTASDLLSNSGSNRAPHLRRPRRIPAAGTQISRSHRGNVHTGSERLLYLRLLPAPAIAHLLSDPPIKALDPVGTCFFLLCYCYPRGLYGFFLRRSAVS